MSEGQRIRELIEYWLEFNESRSDQDISSFARWLNNKVNPEKELDVSDMKAKKIELGQVFGRIINFVELWAKLAFKDLPIRHFEDYGILNGVNYIPNVTKNELANILFDQKSTAFEIIKRLQRDGLLREETVESDKRMKRVKLTKYGEEVFQQAQLQASKISDLLMGDLSDIAILRILDDFKELDKFHTGIYQKGGFDSIEDLLN